ncbi:MAG: CPCC family cysteine-rich protein [Planctomycetia bacterium]|jgi:hypothetical protein
MPRDRTWITCACYGYETVTDEWDRCSICDWWCYPPQECGPDIPGFGNGSLTLRKAQQNFLTCGNCAGPREVLSGRRRRRRHPRLSELQRDPEWRAFPAKRNPVADATAWRRTIVRLFMACPCCGYKTHLQTGHECRICGYYFSCHSGIGDADSRHPKTNRGLSLRECQQHFLKYGAYSPEVAHLRTEPGPGDERRLHWKVFPVRGPNRKG